MHHSSLFGPLFLASSGNTTTLPECGDVPTHASLFHIAAGCLETISVMLGKFIFPALGSFLMGILSHCTHTGCPTAPAADTNHKLPRSSLHTILFPSATRLCWLCCTAAVPLGRCLDTLVRAVHPVPSRCTQNEMLIGVIKGKSLLFTIMPIQGR